MHKYLAKCTSVWAAWLVTHIAVKLGQHSLVPASGAKATPAWLWSPLFSYAACHLVIFALPLATVFAKDTTNTDFMAFIPSHTKPHDTGTLLFYVRHSRSLAAFNSSLIILLSGGCYCLSLEQFQPENDAGQTDLYVVIIVMSVFLECFSMWNMLTCTEQVQIQNTCI